MARILGVGIATLDIINTVDGYPAEDAEVRALTQRVARGGNATNTLVVLSQLGHQCAWAGILGTEPDAGWITADLEHYEIDIGPCRRADHARSPISSVTLNRRNGSRTIVHYRDLPEYRFEDFAALDLSCYEWLHFEGRAVEETRRMLRHAAKLRPGVPRSLEVEKPRPGIEELFPLADVLIFSRAYAQASGHGSAAELLTGTADAAPAAVRVCTWGADGAYAAANGSVLHRPAYSPPRVVDTLGAGDTFTAGLLDALIRRLPVIDALEQACRLAGTKCGVPGFAGLGRGG